MSFSEWNIINENLTKYLISKSNDNDAWLASEFCLRNPWRWPVRQHFFRQFNCALDRGTNILSSYGWNFTDSSILCLFFLRLYKVKLSLLLLFNLSTSQKLSYVGVNVYLTKNKIRNNLLRLHHTQAICMYEYFIAAKATAETWKEKTQSPKTKRCQCVFGSVDFPESIRLSYQNAYVSKWIIKYLYLLTIDSVHTYPHFEFLILSPPFPFA